MVLLTAYKCTNLLLELRDTVLRNHLVLKFDVHTCIFYILNLVRVKICLIILLYLVLNSCCQRTLNHLKKELFLFQQKLSIFRTKQAFDEIVLTAQQKKPVTHAHIFYRRQLLVLYQCIYEMLKMVVYKIHYPGLEKNSVALETI
jgi:hypothetical protein